MSSIYTVVHAPGQVLATWRIVYWHLGIVTDKFENGEQVVISCSGARNMVVEERLSIFAQGFPVEVRHFSSHLPAAVVLARAREKLGETYRLLDWNCEHFVCYAFGLPVSSPQLQMFGLLLVGLLVVEFR